MKTTKITTERQVSLEGIMTFGKTENGLRTADFMCCKDVRMEPFRGNCKVQMMRDGNVYIEELKKRKRNRALFREDNCSLSHGQDKRWYFCFSLDEDELKRLPRELVRQASVIALKVMRELILVEK